MVADATKSPSRIRTIGLALLIPLLPFLLVGELPGDRWLSHDDARDWVFGASGSAVLALDIALPVPSTIVGTLLGARLGLLAGFLWAFAGLVAGNLIGFAAGRWLLSSPDLSFSSRPTSLLVFASRPVPLFAEAVVIAAGAGRLPTTTFLRASLAGNAIFAAALAGNGAAWLPDGWSGPGLALPMLLPVVAWLGWMLHVRRAGAGTT